MNINKNNIIFTSNTINVGISKILKIFMLYLFGKIFIDVSGHGYMEYPIQRSSLWRFNRFALPNYDDNGLNCGWGLILNKSYCGMCGDDILSKQPRLNEIGGKYYTGHIVEKYHDSINIKIKLTANHKGYFEFYLCNLDKNYIETPECFKKLNNKKYYVNSAINRYEYNIPTNVKCSHCILQWVWTTGHNGNVKYNEMFINCADISII